ncbi:mug158 [Symbiodinium pilosum]|uniref:Mug158 protein n=1 Tax=Symbiodinium pilosum TaxID=2952 RepID=A0A812U596_SYMPI|nr:mug158 [Symbiodinium pilosum]
MLWDDMHKNDMVWPTVKEVQEYRKKVYKIVSEVIATHPALEDADGAAPVKITWDHPLWFQPQKVVPKQNRELALVSHMFQ